MDEFNREDLEHALSKARHTISNPLTIISGNVQLLLQLADLKDMDEELIASLEDINEATEELQRLVDEVYTAEQFIEDGSSE
jgi:signal transduction histidine kinase